MANPDMFTRFGIGVGQQPLKEHPRFSEDQKTQRLHHSRPQPFWGGPGNIYTVWGSEEFRPYFGSKLIYTPVKLSV
jgi:hypothetical protein